MEQLDLLRPRPPARLSDPVSSHLAGLAVRKSGAAGRQAEQVVRLVARHPEATAGELAAASAVEDPEPLDLVQVCRRLPELEAAGQVERTGRRVCPIRKKMMTTWRLTPEASRP